MSPQDLITAYILNIGHEIDRLLEPDMSRDRLQAWQDMKKQLERLDGAVRRYKEKI